MKKIKFWLAVNFLFSLCAFAQLKDTIIYDPATKNYHLYYTVTLEYARSKDGSLRKLGYKDNILPDEEIIEKDTVVYVLFEPATKIVPRINCLVRFDRSTNKFVYDYAVENGPSAEQKIDYFILQFGDDVQVQNNSTNLWRNQQMKKPGGNQLDSKWAWSGGGTRLGVKAISPGEKLDGFSLISGSLPAIFPAWLQGDVNNISIFSFGLPSTPIGTKIFRLTNSYEQSFVQRNTVAPSNVFNALDMISGFDTLLSYTHQSVQLGWLKATRDDDCDEDEQPNDGIAKNIEKRIEKAKKELMKGDSTKARKELEKLVKKVEKIFKKSEEAEKKKREREITMTSEAYALLKYNAEYLIERLPEKNRKKQ